ncbi:hypothetical protein BGM19_01240 [Streptomyces agglomeratus]|nr:hypothetical protein BGM19_01240 [Streptomyces agglomeratus]
MVVLSDADLDDLPLPSSPTAIAVLAFVPADRIDPMLLHKPYHLSVGNPAAERPYRSCAMRCARAAWWPSYGARCAPANPWPFCGSEIK